MPSFVNPTPLTEERGLVELSPQEAAAVEARIKAMDELLKSAEKNGKYKIELFFSRARSMHRPVPGVVSLWESGNKMHGGGDSKVYLCPGRRLRINDCEAIITDKHIANDQHFCAACGQVWDSKKSIGEHGAVLTLKNWAEVFLYYFSKMQHDADLVIKYSRDDIRTAAMLEQARQMGGEAFNKVRDQRARSIYPLTRIIRDCSAGASILGRFTAFITA